MKLVFEKYHGLGNDYLVYDPNKHCNHNLQLTKAEIQKICDRNFGVGSDGILMGPYFEAEHPSVRIMNPDGSEAEKSGNGVRIFSKYLRDAGYVQKKEYILKTMGGDVVVRYLNETGTYLRVSMGKASFASHSIPVISEKEELIGVPMEFCGETYAVTCVSMGNPHCIIPTEHTSKELICQIGPEIESAPCFPNRINVQLMEILDRTHIRIEIYERGAGYTLASGSSACAAACAAYRTGSTDSRMIVYMPGGSLEIEIAPDGMVYMTGDVASVGKITLSEEFMQELLS